MGKIIKAALALAIASILMAYLVGEGLIQAEYSGKIAAMKRDLEQYDLRAQDMYREQVKLESAQALLEAHLAAADEAAKAKAKEDTDRRLIMQALPSYRPPATTPAAAAAAVAPINVTVDTSSLRQALKMAAIRQKTGSAGSTGSSSTSRVTRAS